jgi:uncharacterized protein DUF6160
MKGIRNLLLGAAILPIVVNAEIRPIADEDLSGITGQSGVSIDLSAKVKIGELRYQDEGSIAIRNIVLGGANKATYFGKDWGAGTYSGDNLDGVQINLDVMADGDLVVYASPQPGWGQAVDFGLSTGEWRLQKSTGVDGNTNLIDSLSLTGLGLDFRMKVDNQTQRLKIETLFGIDDLDMEVDFLSLGIKDMTMAGSSYFESLGEYGFVGLPDIGASLKLDIYAVNTPGVNAGLAVDIVEFETDIGIGAIELGGTSIGSLYINDLSLSGTSMVIYGH